MNPSQTRQQIVVWLAVQLLQLFAQHDAFVGKIADDFERQNGVDVLQVKLELGGELQEIGHQPEEV